jgi:hypothetical protein
MKRVHLSAILAIITASALAFGLSARPASADEPEIIFQFPVEGQVIAEPPLVLQMCFKAPVNVKDLPPLDEGDFRFSLKRPDNVSLGMRIVFQPDGYGVAIYPGTATTEPPEGEWIWEYRVVDAESGDPLEGEVRFTVNAAEGDAILQPTPPACLAEGATNQPTSVDGSTNSATEDPGSSESDSDDDDDLSVLELALITIGIAAAAAIVGVLAFFFRKRIGYDPHAPKGDDSSDDH